MVFDPVHYLPLLERKIAALDQAAPLVGWELPDVFATLRRLLEARMGKAGKREYVQVLRLLESFDFKAILSLSKMLVLELARCEYIDRRENVIALSNLLIIDELGFVPLSKTGAELLFEVFSQRYERGATLVTSN